MGLRCSVHQLLGGVNDANGYLMEYGEASLKKQMERIMDEDAELENSITA